MEAENDKSISFSDESDWKESKTDSGRTFYVNRQTGQTAWAIGPLPVGWSAREDAVGRIYFIDHATNRKTFNDPRLDPNLNRPAVAASRPVALNSIAQRWVGLSTKRSSMQFIPGLYKSYLNVSVSHGEQIERDLGRTNPTSPYFDKNGDGKGLQQLKNVLCAWALHDPEIGYVQGMNFIVGYLLQQTRNEEQTFWLFARLLQSEYYGVRGMFVDGLPKLWSMCYQVQRGMQRLCPKLAAHFARLKLTGTAWLPQWTMSLFTKYFTPPQLDEFFTLLFDKGWVIVLKMVLSILLCVQDKLLAMVTFGDALLFLNPQPSSVGTGFGVWESVSPDTALFYVKTLKISEEHFTQWEVHYQDQLSRGADRDDILESLATELEQQDRKEAAKKAENVRQIRKEKQRKDAAIGAAVGVTAAVAVAGILGAILGGKKGRRR